MLRTLVFPVALVLLLQASAFSAGVSFSGVLYETPDTPNGVVSADLNRDGLPDLATASSVVSVFLATSPGNFGARKDYTLSGPSDLSDILAADLNGDGALDLIVRRSSVPRLSILWNNGDGTFRNGPTVTLSAPAASFDLGDFNHDGVLDIATVECTSAFPISCSMNTYLGKGNGTFTKKQSVHLASLAFQVTVADLNGDGTLDLAISRTNQVLLWWGKGDGTFSAPTYLSPAGGDDVESFAVADFTNDGKLDIAIDTGRNLTPFMGCVSGSASFYKNMGGNNFSLLWSSPGGCAFLDSIDMNGDLNQDLIFQNGDPVAGFFAGLLGNGNGTFTAPQSSSFPNQGGGAIYVRDFDLDSRDDYIVGFGGISDVMVAQQTGGFKNCKPPNSAELAAKICAPAAGSGVTSPLLVQAAGNSPAGVIQLQVWIDGVKKVVKWHDQIARKFALSPGIHRIAVIAADKYLGSAKTFVNVTVH